MRYLCILYVRVCVWVWVGVYVRVCGTSTNNCSLCELILIFFKKKKLKQRMCLLIVCMSTSGVLLEGAASDEELSTHFTCSNHGQGRLVFPHRQWSSLYGCVCGVVVYIGT